MFRYEAPQSGRYRQHSQVGAETIGSDDPAVDAELIDLLAHLYARLGLPGVRLHLTSIGDPESRAEYARELRDYLLGHDVFDADQRARIEINPMRAFDWDAPEIARRHGVGAEDDRPALTTRTREHFDEVRRAARRGRRSTTSSTRAWCAGSTTTRARCSSSAPTRSARRAASAAAAATTA